MDYGWVSIHRQIQENWLWEDKPFSYGQAWVDLIMMANHTDKKVVLGKEIIKVKAGSFITSELKLMERWGWGKTRVRTFLDLLQKDEMIVKKVNRKRTTICIVNYSTFQDTQTTNKPLPNHKQTIAKPLPNTNNNENNDNNENNNIYASNPELNETIIKFIEHRKAIKKPMTDTAIKLMIGKLNKLSSDVKVQIEILNQSIISGWTSVYPLKNGSNNQSKQKQNSFNNFPQRDYDYEEMERKLLEKTFEEVKGKKGQRSE